MDWFSPRLEPGEALLLKRSGGRRMLWVIGFVLFVFLPLEFGLYLADEPEGLSAIRILGMILAAAITLLVAVLPWLLGESGWQLAVTSRRLIHRPGGLGTDTEEIRVDEIETVQHDVAGNRILLQGGTREIALSGELVKPDRLNEAIEAAKRAA